MIVGSFLAGGQGKMPLQSGSAQSTSPSQSLSILSPQAALVFSAVGEHWVVLVVVDTGLVGVVDAAMVVVVEATVVLVVACTVVEVVAITVVLVVACTVVVVVGHWQFGPHAPPTKAPQVELPGGSHCSGGWTIPSPQVWTVVEVVDVVVVVVVGHVQSWLQARKAPAGEPGGQVMLPGGSHCSPASTTPSPQIAGQTQSCPQSDGPDRRSRLSTRNPKPSVAGAVPLPLLAWSKSESTVRLTSGPAVACDSGQYR